MLYIGGADMDRTYRNHTVNQGSVVDAMNYSFTVTQSCNLACKYCYECKNENSRMSIETAKKAVDFALGYGTNYNFVRFDFMGGEPLLEIEMIDEVVDYIKFKLYEEKHKWFGRVGFDLTTNGVLYDSKLVQRFIEKNRNCLNISMTIDGIKEKHDMNRIFRNGEGSFESVLKNVPLWLSQFPNAGTKVTFASADLQYLKDSLIFLNSLGIKEIVATLVNEDVWHEGDDIIYERQLRELADYMIDNDCPVEFAGGQFSETMGLPYNNERLKLNWCNCGENNFEIDYRGNLYPCVRFLPFALHKDDRSVGNVETGVDFNKLRPFEVLNISNQSSQECLECPIASGCGWCVGNNYNKNEYNSIFVREMAICKMHKARARANDYYWARMRNKKGVVRHVPNLDRKRFLYIMMSDNAVDYCSKIERKRYDNILGLDDFKQGLHFARENFYTPVIVYDDKELDVNFEKVLEEYEVIRIKPFSLAKQEKNNNCIVVVDGEEIPENFDKYFSQILLHIQKKDIDDLSNICAKLFPCSKKVNIIIDDWDDMKSSDFNHYERALGQVADAIFEYAIKGKIVQVNILTDMMITKDKMNCGAGDSSLLLAPNAELYPCSSFYFSGQYQSLGNIESHVNLKQSKYKMCNSPVCNRCDINSCHRCVYNNLEKTRELKIPSEEQCELRGIEKKIAIKLQKRLIELNVKTPFGRNILQEHDYPEVLELIVNEKFAGYR